jgi:hypothetical protein
MSEQRLEQRLVDGVTGELVGNQSYYTTSNNQYVTGGNTYTTGAVY